MRIRRFEANTKFLLGLSFERAALALQDDGYINSDIAQGICQRLVDQLEQERDSEHHYFKIGQKAFDSKTFMQNKDQIQKAQLIYGDNWKSERYHNLVRLGGDAMKFALHEYAKATLLGGLLILAKAQEHS